MFVITVNVIINSICFSVIIAKLPYAIATASIAANVKMYSVMIVRLRCMTCMTAQYASNVHENCQTKNRKIP